MKCVIDQRREIETGQVCPACRQWLSRTLTEIVELYALLPANLMPGQAQGQRVSGSREAPLPLRVDPLDLGMPARAAVVHEPPCTCTRPGLGCRPGYPHLDQVGEIPVATRLDSWVRDWRDVRGKGEGLPNPTVVELGNWLLVRLEDACDDHLAIDEFAGEMREMVSALRTAAGRIGGAPELKRGVPCRECERVALFRKPASDYIECGACGVLLTPDEYTRWTQLISDKEWRPWVDQVVAPQRPMGVVA